MGRKMSDPTDVKQNPAHLFQPGQSGNPKGRPRGSRNKLGDAFLSDLLEDWEENGKAAIKTVRAERPHEYLKVVASILPRQVEIREDLFDDLTEDQLAAIVALADRESQGAAHAGGQAGQDEADPVRPVH